MATQQQQQQQKTRSGYGAESPHPPERPKTPTMRSRIDEKNALRTLNDRLASILDKKSALEDENSLLSKELVTERENTISTLTLLQETYNTELADLRNQLQDCDKERAKLKLAAGKLAKDLEDANNKLDKKGKECFTLKDKLTQAQDELNNLFTALQKSNSDKDKLLADRKELQDEIERLLREIDELNRNLEIECMKKIDLQNAMDSREEDFTVKKQIYEQEIMNIKSHRDVEMHEMDGRLKKDYEQRLENDLQQLRQEFDNQAARNRDAQEALFKQREDDLKSQIGWLKNAIEERTRELNNITDQANGALQKLSTLEGENYGLQQIIRELEKKMATDRDGYLRELQSKDQENDGLRADKDQLIQEYQDLWDTKVALDNEIATYHMLLEGEERRLLSLHERYDPKTRRTTSSESKSFQKVRTSNTRV